MDAPHPPGLSGHKFIFNSYDRCFYLVGGWRRINTDETRNYYPKIWRFNPSNRIWTEILPSNPEAAPLSMASHSAHFVGPQTMLHFGGSLSIRGVLGNSSACQMLDLGTSQWHDSLKMGSLEMPVQNCGHWFGQATALSSCGTKLYVTTGVLSPRFNESDFLELFLINLSAGTSTNLVPMNDRNHVREIFDRNRVHDQLPKCRVRHEMTLYEDEKLYVFGGSTDFPFHFDAHVLSLQTLPCFDLKKMHWSSVETKQDNLHGYPVPRTCFGFCKWGEDSIYIAGGYFLLKHQQPKILKDLWKFHLNTLTWERKSWEFPIAVWFNSMDISGNGTLSSFGGCPDTSYDHRTSEIQSVAIEVGSLTELCLAKLIKIYSNLTEEEKDLVHRLTGYCASEKKRSKWPFFTGGSGDVHKIGKIVKEKLGF